MFSHGIYGLNLRSPRALPGFGPPNAAAPWWTVEFTDQLPAPHAPIVRRADEPDNRDRLELRRPNARSLFLSYADGSHFDVDATARVLKVAWRAPLTFEDALVYLVGPALGAALRLEASSVLHASAVELEGRAVLVMGEAGAGKSTLTAALVDRSLPLVTEDVAALELTAAHPAVFRGGARIKLWDESVVGLRGRADALPALVPTNHEWTKRFLDAGARMVTQDLTPIGCVITLARDPACTTPTFEELAPQERMLALVANGYGLRAMHPEDRAADLERLASLARAVPIKRLRYPDDLARLPDVVNAIVRAC